MPSIEGKQVYTKMKRHAENDLNQYTKANATGYRMHLKKQATP
jgi:hypothetical protein